jgi:hypothetical protein
MEERNILEEENTETEKKTKQKSMKASYSQVEKSRKGTR